MVMNGFGNFLICAYTALRGTQKLSLYGEWGKFFSPIPFKIQFPMDFDIMARQGTVKAFLTSLAIFAVAAKRGYTEDEN